MTEIREIHEEKLDRWVAARSAAADEADTVEGYLDWKRQARETAWLLASEDSRDLGVATASAAGTPRRAHASPASVRPTSDTRRATSGP